MSLKSQRERALHAAFQLEKEHRGPILEYLRELEITLDQAFNALAQDNVYSPGVNAAWRLLGERLGKTQSSEEPFQSE